MSTAEFIEQIRTQPNEVAFQQAMDTIRDEYDYTPTAFRNGVGDDVVDNVAGTNEGSCHIFAFAQLVGLSEAETLVCFGKHYRDVLNTPQGSDHANIRTFMRHGWKGIAFAGTALTLKK
ncbi:MAG: type effector HopPmaJ [Verrucomicrobiaceae bacterium]|nr:type effector HopPmaJ [Verrucomicrobiaceae bacterium]